ncbi:ArsR family transcriptional regulator [Rhodobacter aestuarii]|uniref:Transcriptional regulator, ArsR family n=2 Tax=Rhodobacter group TaxID=3374108 RepID=A0A1N7NMY5_9RHOB|nr:ArsR family transcriptional regulator [Rhodobacter aestuarii]SIS99641.1 transcriptional regulator, ArsR family [Rhodobacter aestuarii]SOC13140.1 ArsR family transcriptional regulator [Rhodobacter sp. JA431]
MEMESGDSPQQEHMLDVTPQPGATPSQEAPDERCAALDAEEMIGRARAASNLLKALAHEGRLMIMCYLASGEKSVTELENRLETRQAAVSQQLARLRLEGLVTSRREGKTIYYSLSDPRAAQVVQTVYEQFCSAS